MDDLETDVIKLENAIRSFVQTIKKPQRWTNINAHTGINIDRPSAVILQILVRHEPLLMRVQDVAHELSIEPPSVTRKVQTLEELGFLTKQHDPDDKRAVCLKATPEGHRAAKKIWEAQRQVMMNALSEWLPEDRDRLIRLLERLSGDLGNTN